MTASERESFAEFDAIASALGSYEDGARRGDPEAMRQAFIEAATIRGSYGGKPVDWTLAEFLDLVRKGGPAHELKTRIVAIEFAGSAAMARLEAENWRGTRYTDFFVLIRRDGAWKIASKVFYAHARA